VTDGTFSYATFFWAIVSLFDDGEGVDIIKNYDHRQVIIFSFKSYFVAYYSQSEVFGTLLNENEGC
jgi:hypothetical protein